MFDSSRSISRRTYLGISASALVAAAASATAQEDEANVRKPDIRNVMMTTTDDVKLATDVYLPSESGQFPTILNRTPYDKGDGLKDEYLLTLLEAGYAVVRQDCRGRFESEGEWEPIVNEQEDGYDTVEWAADQDWSTGKVGMYGHSYVAQNAWHAAAADPPSLEAIAAFQGPVNTYRDVWFSGGAFELGLTISWAAGQSVNTIGRLPVSEKKKQKLLAEVADPTELYEYLPVNENPAFDEFVAPYYFEWLLHDRYSEYWERTNMLEQIEDISAKVLTFGGFYDIFLESQSDAWTAIEERGKPAVSKSQSMIIGPQTHRNPVPNGPVGERELPEIATEVGTPSDVVRWFDHWLKKDDAVEPFLPVQYYQTGATPDSDEWRSAETWPPEDTVVQEMYLNSGGNANSRAGDGTLSTEPATDGADTDDYEYDPLDPVPTTGGPLLQAGGQAGVVDQRAVEDRDDVLVFTSETLDEPLDVVGNPNVTLYVESTAPDTDFSVKLIDVGPEGYAANVTEKHLRARYRETSTGESYQEAEFMEPGNIYELSINLRPVAHTFEEGHQLRLDITSSNFPRIDRNPNRAMDVGSATEDDMQTATNAIHHHADRQSCLSLPVIEEYTPVEPRDNYGIDDNDETNAQKKGGSDSEKTNNTDSNGPGMGIGGALIGFSGAAYLLKGRTSEGDTSEE